MGIVNEFPYPFQQPMAQELLRHMARQYRTERDALALAEQHGIDPLTVTPGLSSINLWHELLEKAAIAGTTRQLVQVARDSQPQNPRVEFLDRILTGQLAAVSAEPIEIADFGITEKEALLFFDDLTMPTGRLPALIATLQRMIEIAPAVCLLRVQSASNEYFGSGFRISERLVLTNEHVLHPKNQNATKVQVDFDYETAGDGSRTTVTTLEGNVASIVSDAADDWAVIEVEGMEPAWPIIELGQAPDPKEGDPAYILQHPAGQPKRLGFVRNTISTVDDRFVHYLTDTQPGSSGSPVFEASGEVLALHHAGGAPQEVAGKPPVSKNEGIRISRVVAGMRERGLRS